MNDDRERLSVEDVLITGELDCRPSRAPDHEAENRALCELAEAMAVEPGQVLQRLAEAAMALTGSGSAGISLLEADGGHGTFRWVAAVGAFAENLGGTLQREASPCGEVVARDQVLLMDQAERAFPALREAAGPKGYESLLAPFHVDGEPTGTVWAIKHSPEGRFEREDARILQSLTCFASAAHGMVRAVEKARHSEELRRIALKSGRMGAWRWDARSRLVWGDAELRALYGVPLSDDPLPAEAYTSLMAPESAAAVEAVAARRIKPGEEFEGELEVAAGPAAGRWVRWRGQAEGGRPWVINGVSFDVTERRQEREWLRESEERYRLIVENARDHAIFTLDARGRIASWPSGAEGVLGWTAAEAVGQPYDMIFVPEDRARGVPEQELALAREAGLAPDVRWHQRRDGGQAFIDGTVRPLLGAGGQVQGYLKVGQDVTERRAVAQALAESEDRFRQFGEATFDVLWTRDAETLQWEYLTPAFEAVYGVSCQAALAGDNFRNWADLIVPEDRERAVANIRRVREGERVTFEFRIRRSSDGGVRWLRSTDFPMRDGDGRVVRIGGVGQDVTGLKAAEAAVAVSEERLRLALDIGRLATWDWNMATGEVVWNDAHYRMQGYEPGEVRPSFEAWRERLHPEDAEPTIAAIEQARDRREEYAREFRNLLPDRTVRWTSARGRFFHDGQGRPTRMIGVMEDVTDRLEAERALAASEARLRTLMEGIPQLVWRASGEGLWTWASPQWTAFTGQVQAESHGLGWLGAVHPDDREAAMRAREAARPHGLLDTEHRVRRASDGVWLWHHARSVPVRDAGGRIAEWLGTTTDVQQLKGLQERQAVMVAELQHRTRNLIAVVRSIAGQTMARTGPTEAFREEFNHRLEALARVQGLLSRSDEEPITIEALIRMELDALGLKNGLAERVAFGGPPARIRHSAVQTLALALHELATNARKHGALSTDAGRLDVRWEVRGEDGQGRRLMLDWIEEGSPPPDTSTAARRGYGRELIERALPYALGARTRYELDVAGVRCSIDMPLEKARSRRSSP